jgi:hypothetical protein
VINRLTDSIGLGWAYVLLAGIGALQMPLVYLEIKKGPVWRAKREAMIEK